MGLISLIIHWCWTSCKLEILFSSSANWDLFLVRIFSELLVCNCLDDILITLEFALSNSFS